MNSNWKLDTVHILLGLIQVRKGSSKCGYGHENNAPLLQKGSPVLWITLTGNTTSFYSSTVNVKIVLQGAANLRLEIKYTEILDISIEIYRSLIIFLLLYVTYCGRAKDKLQDTQEWKTSKQKPR